MKRQDSVQSSSSRRQMAPEKNHPTTTSIGCVSGIFHLLCKYQTRRKLLAFGRKQENRVMISEPNPKSEGDADSNRDIQRSPMLPSEIRRSNSEKSPPALVTRLMGLDGAPPETATEKRRKLMGALEKCDEDLKALKKIIEALRSVEHIRSSPVVKSVNVEGKPCSEINSEQPSPVSVLHDFTRSPLTARTTKNANGGRPEQQQKQQMGRRPGEEDSAINMSLLNRMIITRKHNPVVVEYLKGDDEEYYNCGSCSRAMAESVEEVCSDIDWGEKREVGRIGLALQHSIFTDLIQDTIKEMNMGHYHCQYLFSLSIEACKRRLCF